MRLLLRIARAKTSFALVSAVVVAGSARAATLANVADAVYKLRSGPCNESAAFESSAIVIDAGGERLALGLAHATVAGTTSDVCHTLIDGKGSAFPAKLLAWRWNGLALFSFAASDAAKLTAIGVSQIKTDSPAQGGHLAAVGFRRGAAAPTRIDGLDVVNARSDRGASNGLFEARGPVAIDSGLEGAPLVDGSGFVRGIVASHFVDLDPGHPSVVRFYEPRSNLVSRSAPLVFAHAGVTVAEWIKLATMGGGASWPRTDWHKQWAGEKQVALGGVVFSEDCPKRDGTPQDPTPYPIGGVDPIGIGGSTQGIGCRIWARATAVVGTEPANAWYREIKTLLAKGASEVEIAYVLRENPAIDVVDRRLLGSLEELGKSLFDAPQGSSEAPLNLAYATAGAKPGLDPKLAALRARAADLQARFKELFITFEKTTSDTTRSVIREAYFLSVTVQSEEWRRADASMFTQLLDARFNQAWGILMEPMVGGDKKIKADFEALGKAVEEAQK